jgi:WD40 repeat protein
VEAVAYCPRTGRLATGGRDAALRLWDAEGKPLRAYNHHTTPVYTVTFSPDGLHLVSASRRKNEAAGRGLMIVTDIRSGRKIGDWRDAGAAVVYSPKVCELAACIGMNIEMRDGWDVRRLKGHRGEVLSAAFSRDGKRLVSGSLDHTARVWAVDKGECLFTFEDDGAIQAVGISPDGSSIASGGEDGVIRVWRLRGLEPREMGMGIGGVAFSPDGRWLAAAVAKEARICNARTGEDEARIPVSSVYQKSFRLAWSADSRQVIAGTGVWDLASRKLIPLMGAREKEWERPSVVGGALSPRGLAANPNTRQSPGSVLVWEALSGRPLRALSLPQGRFVAVDFSPDGQWLAAGVGHGESTRPSAAKVHLWRVEDWSELRGLGGFVSQVLRVRFSPDGRLLGAALGRPVSEVPGEVRIYRAGTWELLHRLRGHRGPVYSLAFSPCGRRVASVGGEKGAEARLWDLTTGQEVWQIQLPEKFSTLYDVDFSPCGNLLAVVGTNKKVLVYDGTPVRDQPPYAPLAD